MAKQPKIEILGRFGEFKIKTGRGHKSPLRQAIENLIPGYAIRCERKYQKQCHQIASYLGYKIETGLCSDGMIVVRRRR